MSGPVRGIVGLTGGIASGKSAAAARFSAHGIPVVDADRVGHEMLAPGGAAADAVVAAFGESILTDGAVDREKLGAVVFDDPAALQRLNSIVHPKIFETIGARCMEHIAAGHPRVIVDAALLAERGAREPWLAGLVLVSCDAETRVRRMVETRGMAETEARGRIRAQTDPEQKRGAADWIVENRGTIEGLHAQVDAIVREWEG